jgi:hypothetical protein
VQSSTFDEDVWRVDAEALKTMRAEWLAALEDAGFEVEQVRLYPFPGEESANGARAYYFTPGQEIFYDSEFPDEQGGQIEDANRHRDRHRIAVWTDGRTEVLGAKLRHELEHARAVEIFGNQIFDLNRLVLEVLSVKLEGLKGGNLFYHANPLEVDANAAAARFAWGRYGDETARGLADPETEEGFKQGALFRSLTPPGPVETLPGRMLAFLFQFHDLCELLAQSRGEAFTDLLDEAWPGLANSWTELRAIKIA